MTPVTILCLCAVLWAGGPPGAGGARDLVQLLLGHAKRRGIYVSSGVPSGLGNPAEIATALKLIEIGRPAVRSIEKGLASLEADGARPAYTSGPDWLLYAYARIEGAAAYPVLARMLHGKTAPALNYGLERAVAISLGLSSFRTSLHGSRAQPTFGPITANDALDQLVLSWILDDPAAFQAALGPRASQAFERAVGSSRWRALRQELLRPAARPVVGFGYRLPTPPGDPRSPDPLARPASAEPDPDASSQASESDAAFYREAQVCATVRIVFTVVKDRHGWHSAVNNSDLLGLLRSLSPCLARPNGTRQPRPGAGGPP